MKKLMFAAAVAATTAGAFAGEVQVYDMTINVKTTECKKNGSAITDACGNTFTYYRTQTSAKFEGKFWGCECDVIACPVADDYGKDEADLNSYMFWGKSAAFHNVDFKWDLLQLVGKKTANIEGVWSADFFACEDGTVAADPTASLTGAGYGTAKVVGCADALNQIASMSGNLVGIYNVVDGAGVVGCPYCGDVVACAPYQFCDCVDVLEDQSAAYGTWTLKFNSTVANKIAKGKYITEAYSFKKFVLAEMACIAEEADPEPVEPTAAEKAEKAYNAAVTTYVAATNDYAKALATEKAAGEACQNLKKSAQWIAGTNETVKLFAAVKTAKKALNDLAGADNYVATVAYVAAETAAYDAAVKSYIELSTELKYYGENWTKAQTNAVDTAKKTMEDAYIALENKIAEQACPGGETVKSNLKKAVAAYVAAAEAYYPVVAKYVSYAALQANAWDVDYASLSAYDVDGWKYDSIWIPTVCAKDVNEVYEAAAKDCAAKSTAADEAKADMDTKRSICQALGGDCE